MVAFATGAGRVGSAPCLSAAADDSAESSIRALEARFVARRDNALTRAENAFWVEQARLCALAAGEPRLTCQSDNISRLDKKGFYRVSNTSHYNRAAVALKVNVDRWALDIGLKYSTPEIQAEFKDSGFTQNVLKAVHDYARQHIAELTVTIPHYENEDLLTARRRFTRAFNDLNRRYFKEKFSHLFGEFVRVFEPHKSGVLHAHIIIETKRPLGVVGKPFKFRKYFGREMVDGRTVAPWVCDVWRAFKDGELSDVGIGKIHSLQPIRKGVKEFARYISKYISKDLGKRAEFMKGLRAVAFSRDFLGGKRLKCYENDYTRPISYFDEKAQKTKIKYPRYAAFCIYCSSSRARRLKLARLGALLKCDEDDLKAVLGNKWAFLTRDLVGQMPLTNDILNGLNAFDRLAANRFLNGDKFNSILNFGGKVIAYEDFLKIDSKEKSNVDFDVIGFANAGGAFESIQDVCKSYMLKFSRAFDFLRRSLDSHFKKFAKSHPIVLARDNALGTAQKAAYAAWQGGAMSKVAFDAARSRLAAEWPSIRNLWRSLSCDGAVYASLKAARSAAKNLVKEINYQQMELNYVS